MARCGAIMAVQKLSPAFASTTYILDLKPEPNGRNAIQQAHISIQPCPETRVQRSILTSR
jgi:hypothetical protein